MTKARSNAVANAAKGDLTVGSGTNASGILAVGTNGQVLTADSTQTTGIKWATPSAGGTWTSYTPTWTNLTVGNGTVVAFYSQVGNIVFYAAYLKWGSTTSASGNVSISLPVNADTTIGDNSVVGSQWSGVGVMWDNSANAAYNATFMLVSTSGGRLLVTDTGTFANYAAQRVNNATIPMTWAVNDIYSFNCTYKAA